MIIKINRITGALVCCIDVSIRIFDFKYTSINQFSGSSFLSEAFFQTVEYDMEEWVH